MQKQIYYVKVTAYPKSFLRELVKAQRVHKHLLLTPKQFSLSLPFRTDFILLLSEAQSPLQIVKHSKIPDSRRYYKLRIPKMNSEKKSAIMELSLVDGHSLQLHGGEINTTRNLILIVLMIQFQRGSIKASHKCVECRYIILLH